MSSIPQLLQHMFHLTYLQPDAFHINVSQNYYGKNSIAEETRHVDLYNFEHNLKNLTTGNLEGIDKTLLQEKGPIVFEFLHHRARAFQQKNARFIEFGEDFFELEKSKEIRGFLSLLPASLPKEELYKAFIDNEKRVTIKELRTYKKKVKNDIAPLANFHNDTVDALETFRQEVKGTQAS